VVAASAARLTMFARAVRSPRDVIWPE
jgi:hypothetical protein